MTEGKKLFKFHLDVNENYYNTRPEYLYRMNRFKYNTAIMKPLSFFAPAYNAQGWILKGALVYFAYYWMFKREPYTKHWNREGYIYESAHKTPTMLS